MTKSITNFFIIFFIIQQLKSQISQIDQNGYIAFCDETLHILPLLESYCPHISDRAHNDIHSVYK